MFGGKKKHYNNILYCKTEYFGGKQMKYVRHYASFKTYKNANYVYIQGCPFPVPQCNSFCGF